VVDIRHFNEDCSFHIRHEKEETVNEIREDVLLRESAHFMMDNKTILVGAEKTERAEAKRKSRIIKKSTIISIGLESEVDFEADCEEEEMKINLFVPFGGIL
jgi:hypothetical protein